MLACALQLMRVAEFRDSGHSDKLSLARGMSMTGGIITAAGVIMAIAFGALIFSQVGTCDTMRRLWSC